MRERTELLGGRFELESAPGAGTRVRAFAAARRAGDGRSMSPPIRLLIVDDHPLFLDGLVATLSADEELEVVATAARRGVSRSARRGTHEPDIALLDVAMPGGGIEAARSIAPAVPATRVVMLTSSENEDDLLAAMEAGARATCSRASPVASCG